MGRIIAGGFRPRIGDTIQTSKGPRMTIEERIQSYLGNGGLFNPEMMEHDKVRDLIMSCRDEITKLREELGYYKACVGPPVPIPSRKPFRSEVIVNGQCVAVRWGYPDTYADLKKRAFEEAQYPEDDSWKLTDYEGYEMSLTERLEPAETRTQKPLYLMPPAGIGA